MLRIIAGTEEPDKGQVIMQNGVKLAFLSQANTFPEGATVLSCVAGGEVTEYDAKNMLNTLGVRTRRRGSRPCPAGRRNGWPWRGPCCFRQIF